MINNCINEMKKYGGKSFWTRWLINNGYKTPKSLFIEVLDKIEVNELLESSHFKKMINDFIESLQENKKLAVRSSGVNEDGKKSSKAGNYNTYLNVLDYVEIKESCLNIVNNNDEGKMGILIQQMIEPKISGVIFSSNPVSCSRNEVVVSYTNGLGDVLVSGEIQGNDLVITIENGEIRDIECLPFKGLKELVLISKDIEKKLNFPVDIEWGITKDDQLFILQCRPITSIFHDKNDIYLIDQKIDQKIEKKFLTSDKVKLRLLAQEKEILISKAYLLVANCDREFNIDISKIERSNMCCGYSVVIIFPKKINGKIIRSFIGNVENVKNIIKCKRYGIRSLPDYDNLKLCLESFFNIIKESYWSCSIIIQEILNPLYTGILRKNNDQYIVEFTKGHFASKGVIPMSSYCLNQELKITLKNEVYQSQYIGIIEGCTLDLSNKKAELVKLGPKNVKKIIQTFNKIMPNNTLVIEFGVLKKDTSIVPYLIDISEDKEDNFSIDNIKLGIISPGTIAGKVKILKLDDITSALNIHFYDSKESLKIDVTENTIFYASLPSISFLDILKKYDNDKIGFIFEKGSILCHFSVLLRERNIPAIFFNESININENELVEINTFRKEILRKL